MFIISISTRDRVTKAHVAHCNYPDLSAWGVPALLLTLPPDQEYFIALQLRGEECQYPQDLCWSDLVAAQRWR